MPSSLLSLLVEGFLKDIAPPDLVLCTSLCFVAQPSRHRLFKAFDGVVVSFHFCISGTHVVQGLASDFGWPDEHGLVVGFNTLRLVLKEGVCIAAIVQDSNNRGIIARKGGKGSVKTREGFLVLLVLNELHPLVKPRNVLV